MRKLRRTFLTHHGYGEIELSRYVVLYFVQASWLVLGAVLYAGAFWPSTCQPENLFEVYSCSLRLAESHTWREAGLMTWLWTTPILIVLELLRRFGKGEE